MYHPRCCGWRRGAGPGSWLAASEKLAEPEPEPGGGAGEGTFAVPAVAAGASLEWDLNWSGSSDLTFGHKSESTHTDGKLIKDRCVYALSGTGNPTPMCSPE